MANKVELHTSALLLPGERANLMPELKQTTLGNESWIFKFPRRLETALSQKGFPRVVGQGEKWGVEGGVEVDCRPCECVR